MIAEEGRVVIQAKPLASQLGGEKDGQLSVPARIDDLNGFLDAVHQEPFKDEDGAVNLDPGIEVDEEFAKVLLPCSQGEFLNNQIGAPERKDRR
jgi:hypothetical protein